MLQENKSLADHKVQSEQSIDRLNVKGTKIVFRKSEL